MIVSNKTKLLWAYFSDFCIEQTTSLGMIIPVYALFFTLFFMVRGASIVIQEEPFLITAIPFIIIVFFAVIRSNQLRGQKLEAIKNKHQN